MLENIFLGKNYQSNFHRKQKQSKTLFGLFNIHLIQIHSTPFYMYLPIKLTNFNL